MRKPLLCLGVGLALVAGLIIWLRTQPRSTPASSLSADNPRQPSRPAKTATGAASPRPAATWSPSGLVTETNTPTLLRVRDGVPADSAPRRFLHVRVSPN